MRTCLRLGRAKWSPFKPRIRWACHCHCPGDDAGAGAASALRIAATGLDTDSSSIRTGYGYLSLRSYSSHTTAAAAARARRAGEDEDEDEGYIMNTADTSQKNENTIGSFDHLLPPNLRSGEPMRKVPKRKSNADQEILRHLTNVRKNSGQDALAYLAIDLDRWPVAHHLFNRLIDRAQKVVRKTRRGWLPHNLDWPKEYTLDQISDANRDTQSIETVDLCRPDTHAFAPLSGLDEYLEELMIPDRYNDTIYTTTMSHIWTNLGSILLKAAEMPNDKAHIAIEYFRQVVGRLHHEGIIPDDVYKDASDSTSRIIPGRNHALALLSSRIMMNLSDAEYNAPPDDHPPDVAPPKPSIFGFKIRQRGLGVEVWLELTLRCCIEGGFITEGLRILYQMRQSRQRWHIKPTPAILQLPLPSHYDSWLIDCYDTWDECAAYAGQKVHIYPDRPFMGVGKLSVSRDTVMCILDHLINRLTVGLGPEGNAAGTTMRYMRELIKFLDEDGVGLTEKERHYLAIRLLQTRSIIPEANPKAAESLLRLLSPELQMPPETSRISSSQSQTAAPSFFIGMAHNILNLFAAGGHIVSAEGLMQWMLASRPNKLHVDSDAKQSEAEAVMRPLTPVSLALLMNSSATARQIQIGHSLMRERDGHPPLIPPAAYHLPVLTPSIIRFAGVSGNFELIQSLSRYYSGNWTTSAIKALLEYTIEDEDWVNAERLFLFLRDSRETHWGVSQIMQVAATLIRLEKRALEHEQPSERARCKESLHKGLDFLARVLRGHFGIVIEFTDQTRYDYQELILWEIHKILLSVPGITSKFCQSFEVPPPRRGVPQYKILPPEAFNRLLAAIVEIHGSFTGAKLWRRWCIEPWTLPTRKAPTSLTAFYSCGPTPGPRPVKFRAAMEANRQSEAQLTKFAMPNLNTVRIIMRSALQELNELESLGDEADAKKLFYMQQTVAWAKGVFRKFNYDDDDLERELESYRRALQRD
ncbi:hypothetical protein AAP_06367 [Ascosphaera apis ARSEF 7405]|uniref:Uncharacterized protein n=1 Tax=Ascosphaera apis ARSEF 7405 TaxID=392613 RepID=A0A167UUS1_9EURO|nr:hypothetical protein AAP_06367 [Ascosphaera apis ARSEF 7405]